jgi:hypothetical protein
MTEVRCGRVYSRVVLTGARYWVLWLLLVGCPFVQAQVRESQLRAGVVIGVLRYASWTTPLTSGVINICSLGQAPGFKELAQSRSKITISDKELIFRPLDNISNNEGCAVIIVGAEVDNKKLAMVKQLPVLSICDTCDYPDQHAIALFMSNQRIRFTVDRTLAKQAGVQFSAAMLELAAKVTH